MHISASVRIEMSVKCPARQINAAMHQLVFRYRQDCRRRNHYAEHLDVTETLVSCSIKAKFIEAIRPLEYAISEALAEKRSALAYCRRRNKPEREAGRWSSAPKSNTGMKRSSGDFDAMITARTVTIEARAFDATY